MLQRPDVDIYGLLGRKTIGCFPKLQGPFLGRTKGQPGNHPEESVNLEKFTAQGSTWGNRDFGSPGPRRSSLASGREPLRSEHFCKALVVRVSKFAFSRGSSLWGHGSSPVARCQRTCECEGVLPSRGGSLSGLGQALGDTQAANKPEGKDWNPLSSAKKEPTSRNHRCRGILVSSAPPFWQFVFFSL